MKKNLEAVLRMFSERQFNDTSALVFLLVLILFFFSPVLFFGKIFLNGDATSYTYPVAYFFQHYSGVALNYLSFSGYPVAAAFHFGYFHPLYNIFYRIFDFLFAYHFILFIDFCIAAFFTYRFVRELQVGVYGALIATIAFVFGQFSLAWVSSINIVHGIALLPIVFFCVLKISRNHVRYFWLLAISVGVALLGTHYQFVIFALIGGFVYLCYLLWQGRSAPGKFSSPPFKALLYFSGALLIAFAIGSPQFFHTLDLFTVSARATSFTYHSVWYFDLFRYLLPTFSIPHFSAEEFFPYIGIIPLFFAFGVLCGYKKKILNTNGRFFLFLFLGSLLMTLKYSPTLLILKVIPVLKSFGELSRWLYLGNFSLAIIAAFGFEYVTTHIPTETCLRWRQRCKKILIYTGGFLVLVNGLFFLFGQSMIRLAENYFDAHFYEKTIKLPIAYYHNLIEVLTQKLFLNVSLGNLDVLYMLSFGLILYVLLGLLNKKILFSNVTILAVAFNLILVAPILVKIGSAQLLRTPSTMAEVIKGREKDTKDFRVFGFLLPFAQYQKITALHPDESIEALDFAREALMPNYHLFSEISIVGGYDPLVLGRYQELLRFIEGDTEGGGIEQKQLVLLSRLPFLSMMNVKYVVSPYVFDTSKLKLIFSEKVTRFEVPLYLYENPSVLPPFYWASSTQFLRENMEKDNFKLLTTTHTDPTAITFVECDTCKNSTPAFGDRRLVLVTRDPSRIVFQTESSSTEWLVVSNTLVPGWQATIDGKSAKIYYANYVYQAVEVGPGKHTVSFSYSL